MEKEKHRKKTKGGRNEDRIEGKRRKKKKMW